LLACLLKGTTPPPIQLVKVNRESEEESTISTWCIIGEVCKKTKKINLTAKLN
jgi:hypothetical protein